MVVLVLGVGDIVRVRLYGSVMGVLFFADFGFDDLARELLDAFLLRDFGLVFSVLGFLVLLFKA